MTEVKPVKFVFEADPMDREFKKRIRDIHGRWHTAYRNAFHNNLDYNTVTISCSNPKDATAFCEAYLLKLEPWLVSSSTRADRVVCKPYIIPYRSSLVAGFLEAAKITAASNVKYKDCTVCKKDVAGDLTHLAIYAPEKRLVEPFCCEVHKTINDIIENVTSHSLNKFKL